MNKDFSGWNIEKERIHVDEENRFYKKRDIWWCSIGLNVGFEEDGTSKSYQRPVLVLKGFSKHVCWVIPITTSKKKNSYHIKIGEIEGRECFAIISQLRLIDTKRFTDRLFIVDKAIFEEIRKAVRDLV